MARFNLVLVVLIGMAWFGSPADAIHINVIPLPDDMTDHPGFDPNLSKLTPIVQAAADYWEGIFLDNHDIDVYIRYQDLEPGVLGKASVLDDDGQRPTDGLIRFDTIVNGGAPFERNWYFDPTPLNHNEFNLHQVLFRDQTPQQQSLFYNGSPPDLLEAGFWGNYTGSDLGDDLFTTAAHELGHILGVVDSLPNSAAELADGDYDFNPAFINGANAAAKYWNLPGDIEPEHLRSPDAVMSVGAGNGDRHLPGATDIFAAAAVAGWNSIDLPRMDYLGGTAWNVAGNWEGGTVPDSNDEVFVRHGGNVSMSINSVAGELTIRDGSSVATNDKTMTVTNDVTIEAAGGGDASLIVANGGVLTANDIHVRDGGNLFTAGSIFSTAVSADVVNIHAGGLLSGTGRVTAQSLSISGTVTALAPSGSAMNVLALDAAPGGVVDLDGNANEGSGEIFAVLGNILVSGPLTDSFEGRITIGAGRTIFFDEPWTFGPLFAGNVGQINLQGGATLGQAATLDTDTWTARRGVISVSGVSQIVGPVTLESNIQIEVGAGGTLNFNSATSFRGGSYTGDGTIAINANTTIDAVTTIQVRQFDLDGNSSGQTLTLNAPLTLNVEHVDAGNNVFNGDTIEVNFNSGLAVNLHGNDAWTMAGTMNINLGLFPQTVLSGSPVIVTGTINADGSSRITAATEFSGEVTTADAATRVTLSVPANLRRQVHIFRSVATISGPGTLAVDSNAELQLENGATIGVKLENGGELQVGASPGQATILGNFTQTATGTFAVELGGPPTSNEFDVLHVAGTAALNGTLDVRLIGDFVPQVGAQFAVLTAPSISGAFGSVIAQTSLDVSVLYSPTLVIVKIDALFPVGDYNHNGVVDSADYTIWRDTLGEAGSGLAADGNNNGMIDTGDYDVWKFHFGEHSGSGAGGSSAAPEPAAVAMLLVGTAFLCCRRRFLVP